MLQGDWEGLTRTLGAGARRDWVSQTPRKGTFHKGAGLQCHMPLRDWGDKPLEQGVSGLGMWVVL